MADRWYITPSSGYRRPVTVDRDGQAKAPTSTVTIDAPNGRRYRPEVEREGQTVAAEAGWYALVALAPDAGSGADRIELARLPIIAWELDDWGDAYIVNTVCEDVYPVTRLMYEVENWAGATVLRICHPAHAPEPTEAELRALAQATEDEGTP
jgi:hypothetical protein